MHHITFESGVNTFEAAILIKGSAFSKPELINNYVNPLETRGVTKNRLIAFTLDVNSAGKTPVTLIKSYLSKLLPALTKLGVHVIYCTDASYFKVLTGLPKAEPYIGYSMPCKIKDYEHLTVFLGLNYQQLIYNPALQDKLNVTLGYFAEYLNGTYNPIGKGIIHTAHYPDSEEAISKALDTLYKYPELACDIETFSLKFQDAGIGTIAFAWDKHNGIAFQVDHKGIWNEDGSCDKGCEIDVAKYSYHQKSNKNIKDLLRTFFENYQGKLIFHNANFDVKILIYELWMKDLSDTEGLLKGLDIMTRSIDDTKIIAYLATNSTAGNILSLKSLAHSFAGNYAVDNIKDIRRIDKDKLLKYNLVDTLSTHYVKDTYYPILVQDQREELYKGLMLDSLKLLLQIELTGMPLSSTKVDEVKNILEDIQHSHLEVLQNSPVITMLNMLLQTSAWDKDFETRKSKAKNPGKILPKNISEFNDLIFNPNSGAQVARLLHEQMGLPILDMTTTGLPATGSDTLKKLLNHTHEAEYKSILEALIGYGEVSKILNTFIPAFISGLSKGEGDTIWLHGNFNIGGTVSGRLSSSDPNLQNIPAKSKYAKYIKECFVAAEGWLFCGADFNSLEDYISALTTKDPNKMKVYEDGYDGHALRAVNYYPEAFTHIDINDPKSVNQLKKQDHPLRQESKVPTFALTYQGTHKTLMNNLGWTEEKAKKIEKAYHEMYKVSDDYIQSKLAQASKDGYVTCAFGLRVRTPLLSQVVYGSSGVPNEAMAEGRTAGNALGQSYGLLNNRAAVEFMKVVWKSKYKYDIKPVALIHDAIYIYVRRKLDVIEFANTELIKAMRWQELPEIQHDKVKLGAALDIYYPSWAHPITLPNDADAATLDAYISSELEKRKSK